jgi:cathepsin L
MRAGGWMDEAFKFSVTNNGLALASDYAYQNAKGSCQQKTSVIGKALANSPSTKLAEGVATSDSVIISMLQEGVLSAAIYVPNGFFSYSEGIFVGGRSCEGIVNHAINIVGYGTDASGKDYWLIRNSWGSWWGEGGYMRLGKLIIVLYRRVVLLIQSLTNHIKARGVDVSCNLNLYVEKANIA